MRRKGLAVAGLLALLLPVAVDRADAAVACPAECLRTFSDSVCRREVITRADGSSSTTYYFWGYGH